jgi:hypothetical protein
MRATGLSEAELGGELSGMLSRVGFLKSFNDELLDEAHSALEDALRTGDADSWTTRWNLANIALRKGEIDIALADLDEVAEAATEDLQTDAVVLFYVPGRAAADCLVQVTGGGCLNALLELQRAVVANGNDGLDLADVVSRCQTSEVAVVVEAAGWVAESVLATS